MPAPKEIEELVEATRVFVARHEEALLSASPPRLLEACEGLHQGLAGTLAAEAGRMHNELLALGRTPPRTPGRFAPSLARLRSGDPFEREAWAYSALAKRVAEAEGALLYLRLTLSKGTADGPAAILFSRRVSTETLTVHKCLAATREVLAAWADAARACLGETPSRAPERTTRSTLRAARECLLAGVPEGAMAPLRDALLTSLAATLTRPRFADVDEAVSAWRSAGLDLPATEEDLRAADEALRGGTSDVVLAWRLLDLVESVTNAASMTRGK